MNGVLIAQNMEHLKVARNIQYLNNMNIPTMIVLHSSDVRKSIQPAQFNSINNYHKEQGFPVSSLGIYVGYHALIEQGKVIECRLPTDEGAHCNQQKNGKSINFQSLGACVSGDYDVEKMSPEDYDALRQQVWAWQAKYNIPNSEVYFHRHFNTLKTCAGLLLTDEWLKGLLKQPNAVPSATCVAEKAELEVELSTWKRAYQWIDDILKSKFK